MGNIDANQIAKKVITKYRVIEGVFIAAAIVLVVLGAKYAGLPHKWPASIALLLFFLSQKKTSNLKNIFCGAIAGILLAASLPKAAEFCGQYVGKLTGSIVVLFIYIALIVVLGDVLHVCFNTITFCYFTVAVSFAEQMTISWLITLIIGGGFLIGAFIIFDKMVLEKYKPAMEADGTNY